jgi:hypothetical protein
MSGITCCGTCLFAKIASRLSLFPGLPKSIFGETVFKQWFRLMLMLTAVYWVCSSTDNQLNAAAQAKIMRDNPDMIHNFDNPHWRPYISGEHSTRAQTRRVIRSRSRAPKISPNATTANPFPSLRGPTAAAEDASELQGSLSASFKFFDAVAGLLLTAGACLTVVLCMRARRRFLIPPSCDAAGSPDGCLAVAEGVCLSCIPCCGPCSIAQVTRSIRVLFIWR